MCAPAVIAPIADCRTGPRVINEQLTTVRRYDRAEAAQMLNIKETWLNRWVTARCIPHQRSGNPDGVQQRGVWFTLTDILAIGRMLPELMRPRQKKRPRTALTRCRGCRSRPPEPSSRGAISASAETWRLVDRWRTCALRLPRVPCGSGP